MLRTKIFKKTQNFDFFQKRAPEAKKMKILKKYNQNRKGLQKLDIKHGPYSPKEEKYFLKFFVNNAGILKYSQKYRNFFFYFFGSISHVLYPIFEALFGFGGIFSKFSFFDPFNPPI